MRSLGQHRQAGRRGMRGRVATTPLTHGEDTHLDTTHSNIAQYVMKSTSLETQMSLTLNCSLFGSAINVGKLSEMWVFKSRRPLRKPLGPAEHDRMGMILRAEQRETRDIIFMCKPSERWHRLRTEKRSASSKMDLSPQPGGRVASLKHTLTTKGRLKRLFTKKQTLYYTSLIQWTL
jgi:hypothetical protein